MGSVDNDTKTGRLAESRPGRIRIRGATAWMLLAALLLGMPGCGGCNKNKNSAQKKKTPEEIKKQLEEEKKKREEKRKPDYEMGKFQAQPNDMVAASTLFKPGHWTSGTVEVWANNFNFNGELVTDPFQLEGMPYRMGTSRPAQLPKGQRKFLETVFYVPPGRRGSQIAVKLTPKGSTRDLVMQLYPASRMPAHQFHMLILANEPDRYAAIRDLDSCRPRNGNWEQLAPYYRVWLPAIEHRTPLPSHMLTLTSTAYVLWDGVDPAAVTPAQQKALLDWLHWGGQLIVSGPGSLDLLKGSFLEPVLPAVAERDIELTQEDMAAFSRQWTVGGDPLEVVRPWSAKQLRPVDKPGVTVLAGTQADGGGEPLIVERELGRGRVVLTAFSLAQRDLAVTKWQSFDGFFNALLLRRPARRMRLSPDEDLMVDWKDGKASRLDPQRVSAVRIYSRDGHVPREAFKDDQLVLQSSDGLPQDEAQRSYFNLNPFQTLGNDLDTRPDLISSGVAGWNSFNDTAELSRMSLRNAAGIQIPDARFVVWMLAGYLIILVPLNWGLFRLLGRVEWAWIAAPLITIASTFYVVYKAQLDIGFASARTELAIVELQGDYPRAHVTRYTALYTSLSTSYGTKYDDNGAVVQPFPLFSRNEEGREMLRGQSVTTVNYRRENNNATLAGFQVPSNATGMLHSEHMLDVGGGVFLRRMPNGEQSVVNGSDLNLRGAAIIGQDQVAWIGDLAAGESKPVAFMERTADFWFEERDDESATSKVAKADVLNLRFLVKMAERESGLAPGETRLVAYSEAELPGMSVEPEPTQYKHASLVVAHLRYASRPLPERDVGSRAELIKKQLDPLPLNPDVSLDINRGGPTLARP